MKSILCYLFFFIPLAYQQTHAQVYFKTEYISSTSYKDEENKLSGAKGDLKVIQGGFRVPLSVKMNENNSPTAWVIGCSASHASMSNKKLPVTLCPSDMLNLQIGLTHTRPLNAKWSMLVTVGAGLYMDSDNLSKARWDNILGQGAIVFIRHLRPNLDLGVGAALNNTFGYPMLFPAFYFNWRLEGRYEVNIALIDAVRVSVGMKFNNHLKLSLVAEMDGMMALSERNGKKMYFTQQYVVVGLRPEFTLGKSLSIPLTLGITPARSAFYSKRSLKEYFSDDDESDPHFRLGFYCSLGIAWKF